MRKTILNEEQEKQLINYYNNHCDQNVTKKFHISLKSLYEILNTYGIKQHTKEELKVLHNIARKNSLLKKYGVENVSYLKKVKQKKLDKLEESKIKRKNTLLKRYGKLSFFDQEKQKNTIKSKYEVENISQLDWIKIKKKETLIKHYGSLNQAYYNRNEKSKKTNLKKYGVENVLQNPVIHAQAISEGLKSKAKNETLCMSYLYTYDNLKFDSLDEVFYFIYKKDNGYDITRNTKNYFTYNYSGHIYYYIPDFILNNTFVEIKGEQFIDNSGNLIPLLSSKLTHQQKTYLKGKCKSKFKCMLENNILCISTKQIGVWTNEVLTAKKYVEEHYGINFIKELVKNRKKRRYHTKYDTVGLYDNIDK